MDMSGELTIDDKFKMLKLRKGGNHPAFTLNADHPYGLISSHKKLDDKTLNIIGCQQQIFDSVEGNVAKSRVLVSFIYNYLNIDPVTRRICWGLFRYLFDLVKHLRYHHH